MNDPTKRIPISECIVGATLFGKIDAFRAVGGFKPMYGGDNDLHRRLLEGGFQVEKLDSPTYRYHRDVPDSMCDAVFVNRDHVESSMEIGL
jgi:GT2 family glycosyltransferase